MSQSLSKSFMNPAKTLSYNTDGNGRDTYIFKTNGGFYPEVKTNGVEEIGKSHFFSQSDSPFAHRFFCNRKVET
jgi:hypothetical protein